MRRFGRDIRAQVPAAGRAAGPDRGVCRLTWTHIDLFSGIGGFALAASWAGCPEGGIVLDPFFGTGTTGYVAQELSRRFVGIELN